MAKQMSVFDGSNWRLVNQPSVFDGANWRNVDVAWVYEPAASTMTGWTVVFGTLTPTVSITSTTSTGNSITLNWDSEYQEYINILYTLSGGSQQQTGLIYTQSKSYTITGLSSGTYSTVLRIYSETNTLASDSTTIFVPSIPTVSNFTTTSKTFNQASFSWNSTNQATYRIVLYFPSGEGTGQLDSGTISSTSARTYIFNGLSPDTTYTPQIIIASSTGNTASQSGSNFTTDPPPPPTNIDLPQISGSRAIGESRSVTNGTWSGVGTLFYRYQWVRSFDNSSWSNISGADSSSYTLQAADNGAFITCRVGARLLVGSSFSSWVDVLAPSTLGTVGYKPTISNVTASSITTTSATISWNSTNQTTYRVQLDFGSVDTGTVTSGVTSVNMAVVGNASYNATVTLGNDFGLAFGYVSFTTPMPNPPGAPIASASLNGTTAIDFSWTTPSNGGGTLSTYQIERSTTSSTSGFTYIPPQYGIGTNSTTFTGLSSGVTYWHRIRAFNEAGGGSYSNAPGVFIPTVPAAPSLSGGLVGTNSINLSWTLGSDGGTPLVSQQIERSISFGAYTFWTNVTVGTTTRTDSGLSAGTIYGYRMRVSNSVGFSSYSNSVFITTPSVPNAPGTPSNQRLTGPLRNRVSWSAPSNGGSAITGYKVYRNQSGGTTGTLQATVSGSTTTVDISGNAGFTYHFFVIATNAVGDGPQSPTSAGVTL
jgi:hypothetical protein